MAPAGPFEKWFEAPVHKRGEDYNSFKEMLADRLIDAAERHYLPGLRDAIQIKEIGTPATNISYVNARRGGIYGPEHTPNQTFFRRFLPVTGVDGLFLCGASVLGGGIMPCTMSGMLAARSARGFLREKKTA